MTSFSVWRHLTILICLTSRGDTTRKNTKHVHPVPRVSLHFTPVGRNSRTIQHLHLNTASRSAVAISSLNRIWLGNHIELQGLFFPFFSCFRFLRFSFLCDLRSLTLQQLEKKSEYENENRHYKNFLKRKDDVECYLSEESLLELDLFTGTKT